MSIEWLLTKTQNTTAQEKASQTAHQQAESSQNGRLPTAPAGPPDRLEGNRKPVLSEVEGSKIANRKSRRGVLGFLLGRFS